MSKATSPYYPPRARWYRTAFDLAGAVRRSIALDRIYLPPDVTWGGLAVSFVVPGAGVWLRGPRVWGRAAIGACMLLLAIFILWLGYPLANLAFGLVISIHASGFIYYCRPLLAGARFRFRLLFSLLVLMLLGLAIYRPLRDTAQNHCVMAVRRNDQVLVLNKFISPESIQRGDLIMYSLSALSYGDPHGGGAVWLRAGFGWGAVLAVGGDRVTFSTNGFTVNGVQHALRPHMPQNAEVVVPEKHWFIWPELDIGGHGNVGETAISGALLHSALVSEDQFAGKPFRRWFWRQQNLL